MHLDIEGAGDVKVNVLTVDLEQVLAVSDFITLHVPGGEVIGAQHFSLLKDKVILINTSRGGVINETALLEHLNSGKVAVACLDVFENEPKPLADLLKHPKVSLTPHIGAATQEAQERIGIELAELIIAKLQ